MELKNIAGILNTQVIKNAIGLEETIAEDLGNLVEVTTKLSEASESMLKDFSQAFVAGVLTTDADVRVIPESQLDIFHTTEEFKGIIQRIKATGFIAAIESPVGKLQNNASYIDGKYHGMSFSNEIVTKWGSFRIPFSLPGLEHVKTSFSSIEGVSAFVSLIKANYENSRRSYLYQLEKRVLCSLIVNCYNGEREIKLVTMWNTAHPDDTVTAATCLENAVFLRWAGEKWARLQKLMTEQNKKYNDSSVITFVPSADIKAVMLDEFKNAIDFNMLADTRNLDKVSIGNFTTLPAWQNLGDDLIPSLGVTAQVKETDGATEDPTITTVSNVVGVIYDKLGCACTSTPLPLAQEVVGAGRFINYYDDEETQKFVDPRNSAVIFTLN